jgi:hypothetical protein
VSDSNTRTSCGVLRDQGYVCTELLALTRCSVCQFTTCSCMRHQTRALLSRGSSSAVAELCSGCRALPPSAWTVVRASESRCQMAFRQASVLAARLMSAFWNARSFNLMAAAAASVAGVTCIAPCIFTLQTVAVMFAAQCLPSIQNHHWSEGFETYGVFVPSNDCMSLPTFV